MLQRMLYSPQQDYSQTKQLRSQYAGNQEMQQKLAVDDRYHQGNDMVQDSPLAALGALVGQVPYDAAKLAYFNGPKPVKNMLGNLSESIFPGEGFNDKTTSRPELSQYGGMLSGMLHGLTQPRQR